MVERIGSSTLLFELRKLLWCTARCLTKKMFSNSRDSERNSTRLLLAEWLCRRGGSGRRTQFISARGEVKPGPRGSKRDNCPGVGVRAVIAQLRIDTASQLPPLLFNAQRIPAGTSQATKTVLGNGPVSNPNYSLIGFSEYVARRVSHYCSTQSDARVPK